MDVCLKYLFFYFCLKLKQVKILKIGIVILVQLYKIISRLFSYPFQRTLILAYLIFTSKPLGAFKNVDQILHNFDYLTTYPPRVDNCGQFTYYLNTWRDQLSGVERGLSTHHLPPSSFPRSYWMPPCPRQNKFFIWGHANLDSPNYLEMIIFRSYIVSNWIKIIQQ